MQRRFVEEFMRISREGGLHVALDTSGYSSPEILERLSRHADMVLLDLKVMDPGRHRELTGVDIEPVLDSARMIDGLEKPVWVRTPIIPGCTDTEENIAALGEFIAGNLKAAERWDLLAFNNTCVSKYARLGLEWELDGAGLLDRSVMESLAQVARASGVREVEWSGATRRED